MKPGDRVRPGCAAVQINADKQQAAVRSTEASRGRHRGGRRRTGANRSSGSKSLVQAGAISRQEFDQAQNSLRTAEARMAALDAQVREGRVELEYYRVNSPQAGVVGDITLRVGDRVTPTTVITTIDDNSALEADIQVPLDRVARSADRAARPDPRRRRQAGRRPTRSSFVAPRVDDRTQTVLVKSAAPRRAAGDARTAVRARPDRLEQHARPDGAAHRRRPDQRTVFLLRRRTDRQGGLVARQRPIEVGELVGNDYVVRSGLKAGDRIITSGIQKLGNGAPVKPE